MPPASGEIAGMEIMPHMVSTISSRDASIFPRISPSSMLP